MFRYMESKIGKWTERRFVWVVLHGHSTYIYILTRNFRSEQIW